MIRVTFLGTAAARPTVARNVTALSVQREGDHYLFDCGEGTQRQMMRYGTGFALDGIFVTHLHADHFLGLVGLLRTMGLQGRRDPLPVFGPPGGARILQETINLGVERVPFSVPVKELAPGEAFEADGYRIEAIRVEHGTAAVGWRLVEEDRLGRFDVDRARELGVPEGPLFGRLHRGETVEVEGRSIAPSQVVGPSRPGRTVVFTGDTRPCDPVREAARDADLLIHDATFGEEEGERAHQTGHSTAGEAARVGRDAGAHRLYLTHLSARYSDQAEVLEREARGFFPEAVVARDGLSVELPYRSDG